jgi:hypothetical protein
MKGRKAPLHPDRRAIIEGSADDLKAVIRDLLCSAALPITAIEYTASMSDMPPYERGYLDRYQDQQRKRRT